MTDSAEASPVSRLIRQHRAAFADGRFAEAQAHAAAWTALARDHLTIRDRGTGPVTLSLIVLSHRASDRTLALLDWLGHLTLAVPHEVIIVVNGDARLRDTPLDDQFTILDSPDNLGASAGRNLAAEVARGDYLVFIDDDGETTADSVMSLYRTARGQGAIGVRGRVRPRDPGSLVPPHYDPGPIPAPSVMEIEGLSLWQTAAFREVGGFDPLLFGFEGPELCLRLSRHYGPQAFLYEPDALLIHDFAPTREKADAKAARYAANTGYLRWKGLARPRILQPRGGMSPEQRAALLSCMGAERDFAPLPDGSPRVSVLTTARNAAGFLADFTNGLKRQTYPKFELVFVDDGSDDDTAQVIAKAWQGDDRLVLVRGSGAGRSAALNTALAHATCDYCVIADADDIALPRRIEWSLARLLEGRDCVAGHMFTDESAVRGTQPLEDRPVPIPVRAYAGMPAPFTGFAFRRDRFPLPFDESLAAGVDCDWLLRHLAADPTITGDLMPFMCSWYRLHPGQITTNLRDLQREVSLRSVEALHRAVIPFDADRDRPILATLLGWDPPAGDDGIEALHDYVQRFRGFPGADAIRGHLIRTVEAVDRTRLAIEAEVLRGKLRRAGRRDATTQPSETDRLVRIEDDWRAALGAGRSLRERLSRPAPPPIPAHFDEAAYLADNPDVAAGVMAGRFTSGFHHFVLHGRAEGRARPLRSS